MRYRFHNDIVYTKVSGISLLVTLRGSWDKFPPVQELSALQGNFCQGIEAGMDEEELVDNIRMPGNSNKEFLRKRFHVFVDKMLESGCLIPVSEDNSVENTAHES